MKPVAVLFVLMAAAAGMADGAPPPPADAMVFKHGLSYFGELRYPADFKHFEWADPRAVKGGVLRQSAVGRFDTFNPLIEKGRAPAGIANFGEDNVLYDRLLQPTTDRPAEKYGRLAESVAVSDDLTRIAFRLRRSARFHDGVPITAHDVKFTLDMIKEHGGATLKTIYRDVSHATLNGDYEIVFHVGTGSSANLNIALYLASLYALPRHYWADREFNRTTTEPPLGSGPYRIREHRDGKWIVYERVADYWGADLPVNVGRHNFDALSYDYFLDKHVQKESLKGDIFDVLLEDVAKDWYNNYQIDEVARGLLVKELVTHQNPAGFPVAIMWNLREPMFDDVRVREALWWLYDFEWSNRVLYHDFYLRADSYFTNTELSHSGTLPSAAELAILEPHRGRIPERVFTDIYRVPDTTGRGVPRESLVRAERLFAAAGWVLKDGRRVHRGTGEHLTLDFMYAGDHLERVGLPYVKTLEKMGIAISARTIEPSNYVSRLRRRKFDATILGIGGSLTPGVELRSTYGSYAADVDSSLNLMGIQNPIVDELVEGVIAADSPAKLSAAARALDRVLLWNFYGVPGFYAPGYRFIYWNRLSRPAVVGKYRPGFPDTWWWDDKKARDLEVAKGELAR